MLRNVSISSSNKNEKAGVIQIEESSLNNLDLESKELNSESLVDAVFGKMDENGPAYRSLGWKGATVLMCKSQIGLGVLTIPSTLTVLGIIPGMIVIFGLGILTTYGDTIIGDFKIKHPEVYSLSDVGDKLFGKIGREIVGLTYFLFMISVTGAAILSVSISLNAVSLGAACTMIFVAVGAIVIGGLASIQTLSKISWLGWIGMISIVVSILTLTVAVGLEDRPAAAPQTGAFSLNLELFNNPGFADVLVSVSNILFAYAGTPAFFNIASEMKNPKDFNKAVLTCQIVITIFYGIIGGVVWGFTGQYISSPALGSAGGLVKRVTYGLAIPALIISGVLYSHLSSKYILVRVLRGSKHLSTNTKVHYLVWGGSVFFCVALSFWCDFVKSVLTVLGSGFLIWVSKTHMK